MSFSAWLSKPAVHWGWFPWFMLALWTLLNQLLPDHTVNEAISENGLIEFLQFLVAALACLGCCWQVRRLTRENKPGLMLWFLAAALGCLYIAGEEVSWGQWFFFWETPAHFAALNDQNETNFHNMSSWLDQKPQMILEIAMVVGGLVLPWVVRRYPARVPAFLKGVTPVGYAGLTVAAYLFVKFWWIMQHWTGFNLYIRASEVVELILYYFLAIYAWFFRRPAAQSSA